MKKNKKQRIALFGGSFDPVHIDHLNIAKACYEALGFDQVWFIPAFLNPFKDKQNSSIKQRLDLLQLIIRPYEYMHIQTYEIEQARPVQSYETILYLTNQYTNYDFNFIIGSDQLSRLEEWNNFEEILKIAPFIVFDREDNNFENEIIDKYNLHFFKFKNNHLSSTEIRNLKKLDLQVPRLNEYVNSNLMYIEERIESRMSPTRFQHSVNVGMMAKSLAKKWNIDANKAYRAGLLHDIAKEWSNDKMLDYLKKYGPELMTEPQLVWHSFVGGMHLEYDWLIKDKEIISAVFNHTVGKIDMSILDKVVFCADKISSDRNYYDIELCRQLCFDDLDKGFQLLLQRQYDQALKKYSIDQIGSKLIQTMNSYLKYK